MAAGVVAATCALGPATVAAKAPPPRPRVLSLRYGKFHPAGASHRCWSLRIRARDPDGSILSIQVEQLRPGHGIVCMDIGCSADKHDRDAATWYARVYLYPARYRGRITLTSASCECSGGPLQERSFIRRLRVR